MDLLTGQRHDGTTNDREWRESGETKESGSKGVQMRRCPRSYRLSSREGGLRLLQEGAPPPILLGAATVALGHPVPKGAHGALLTVVLLSLVKGPLALISVGRLVPAPVLLQGLPLRRFGATAAAPGPPLPLEPLPDIAAAKVELLQP